MMQVLILPSHGQITMSQGPCTRMGMQLQASFGEHRTIRCVQQLLALFVGCHVEQSQRVCRALRGRGQGARRKAGETGDVLEETDGEVRNIQKYFLGLS